MLQIFLQSQCEYKYTELKKRYCKFHANINNNHMVNLMVKKIKCLVKVYGVYREFSSFLMYVLQGTKTIIIPSISEYYSCEYGLVMALCTGLRLQEKGSFLFKFNNLVMSWEKCGFGFLEDLRVTASLLHNLIRVSKFVTYHVTKFTPPT